MVGELAKKKGRGEEEGKEMGRERRRRGKGKSKAQRREGMGEKGKGRRGKGERKYAVHVDRGFEPKRIIDLVSRRSSAKGSRLIGPDRISKKSTTSSARAKTTSGGINSIAIISIDARVDNLGDDDPFSKTTILLRFQ